MRAQRIKTGFHRLGLGLALICAVPGGAGLFVGCSSVGPFHDLPPKASGKNERQGQIDGMAKKAQSHETDAAKQIEKDK
jgi:hypothetical protein